MWDNNCLGIIRSLATIVKETSVVDGVSKLHTYPNEIGTNTSLGSTLLKLLLLGEDQQKLSEASRSMKNNSDQTIKKGVVLREQGDIGTGSSVVEPLKTTQPHGSNQKSSVSDIETAMNKRKETDSTITIMLDKDSNRGNQVGSNENWNMVTHRKSPSNVSLGSQSESANELLCSNSSDTFLKDTGKEDNVMAPTLNFSNSKVNKIIKNARLQ